MPGADRQRIDKWLFFARVVKSRSLAARLVQAGRVRLNREKTLQAADTVRAGDVLTITLDRRIVVYRVRDAGWRRGPAEEARLLYEDMSPPRSAERAPPDEIAPVRSLPGERPTRRQRLGEEGG